MSKTQFLPLRRERYLEVGIAQSDDLAGFEQGFLLLGPLGLSHWKKKKSKEELEMIFKIFLALKVY